MRINRSTAIAIVRGMATLGAVVCYFAAGLTPVAWYVAGVVVGIVLASVITLADR